MIYTWEVLLRTTTLIKKLEVDSICDTRVICEHSLLGQLEILNLDLVHSDVIMWKRSPY